VGIGIQPRPARASGPPIWIGGSSTAAIRRAARFGDGWLPQGPPKMGMRSAIELIRTERLAAGLPEAFDMGVNTEPVHIGTPDFEVPRWTLSGSVDEVADGLRKYRRLDVNQWQLRFIGRSASEVCDQIERFGAEVWPLVMS
jgi:alkanesulfonate monooxygenase SsuD/methylene tetrahydromethanopterin reductase-like flavin-dependent oxidoreductase (luciferase family)